VKNQMERLTSSPLSQNASARDIRDREATAARYLQGRSSFRDQDTNGLGPRISHADCSRQADRQHHQCKGSPWSRNASSAHRRLNRERSRVSRTLNTMLVVMGK